MLFPLDRKDSLNDVIETKTSTRKDRNPCGDNVARILQR